MVAHNSSSKEVRSEVRATTNGEGKRQVRCVSYAYSMRKEEGVVHSQVHFGPDGPNLANGGRESSGPLWIHCLVCLEAKR